MRNDRTMASSAFAHDKLDKEAVEGPCCHLAEDFLGLTGKTGTHRQACGDYPPPHVATAGSGCTTCGRLRGAAVGRKDRMEPKRNVILEACEFDTGCIITLRG